ncbi:MAG: methylated-DNA--[protein]-cysteine S-methyltransferase [Planctomycetes bacterium]|nr:methylated-DNA--[protein]-cysteine S-methyltransferase [Planctomycetota bacterium]
MGAPGAARAGRGPLRGAADGAAGRRWTDAELRAAGFPPARVRRWFQAHHGLTFHGYCRARRLGGALGRIRHGEPVTTAALGQGYESLSGFHEAFRKLTGSSPTAARATTTLTVTRLPTPLGPMVAVATEAALCLLEFGERRALETELGKLLRARNGLFVPGSNAVLDRVAAELDRYFAGALRDFDLPLAPQGTPFQRAVWAALREIPYGATRSYADVARAVGRPQAVRAVGAANGANPIPILIPCHRVVGSDGSLTGYGGGLWRKRRLLELEGGWAPSSDSIRAPQRLQ